MLTNIHHEDSRAEQAGHFGNVEQAQKEEAVDVEEEQVAEEEVSTLQEEQEA